MDTLKEELYMTYQEHKRYVLYYEDIFEEPNDQLCQAHSLLLKTSDANVSMPTDCTNLTDRTDFLNRMELETPDGKYSFLIHLATFCMNAKIYDCKNPRCCAIQEKMRYTAPECNWNQFREWAIKAMSCQQGFTWEQKLSLPHTHLVNLAFGCFRLASCLHSLSPTYRSQAIANLYQDVDLADVCNVIFWMTSIQNEMGLSLTDWDHDFIPKSLILPQMREALFELQTLKVCKNRIWKLVALSERKEADLPDIIRNLRSYPSIRHDDHELCTQAKCQGASIDSTKHVQLHKCLKNDCKQITLPTNLLSSAVRRGVPTAWDKDGIRLTRAQESYVAISHVWSDGTGVGGDKIHGTVNSCLLEFFARVAEDLGCDGIWWDTISIPIQSNERSVALSNMHNNYERAICTVVHDMSLLNQY